MRSGRARFRSDDVLKINPSVRPFRPIARGCAADIAWLDTKGCQRHGPTPFRYMWQHQPDLRPSAPARCATAVSGVIIRSSTITRVSEESQSGPPAPITLTSFSLSSGRWLHHAAKPRHILNLQRQLQCRQPANAKLFAVDHLTSRQHQFGTTFTANPLRPGIAKFTSILCRIVSSQS